MKTIEINNKHYTDAKVVMLTTKDKTSISLGNSGKGLIYHTHTKPEYFNRTYQHLYITSNEEIKEGDWYIDPMNDGIYCCNVFKNGCRGALPEVAMQEPKCSKIVSSTDKLLELPTISKEFIQSYIESYNNGKVIEDVLVEVFEGYGDNINNEINNYKYYLNLKDNTITIKEKEESWSEIISRIYNEIPETEFEIYGDRAVITQYLMDNYLPKRK